MSRTRPPKAVRSILYIHWKLRYYPSNNPINYLATNVTKKLDHNKVIIRYMETDKDHIHYMIETEPTMSISKSTEELYNISYLGKISELFTKTFLERAYLLDGRIFCLQCRKCFRRDAPKIYRKSRVERW